MTNAHRKTLISAKWQLDCRCCGKSVETTLTEILLFGKNNWPQCCEEVMVLVVPKPHPVATSNLPLVD